MRVLCALLALVASSAALVCQEDGDATLRCTVDRLDGVRVNSSRPAAVRTLEITCSDRLYLHRSLDLELARGFRGLRVRVACVLRWSVKRRARLSLRDRERRRSRRCELAGPMAGGEVEVQSRRRAGAYRAGCVPFE